MERISPRISGCATSANVLKRRRIRQQEKLGHFSQMRLLKLFIYILGPLPLTKAENRFVLVIMDKFTRFPELFAMQDMRANTVAKIFAEGFICRHGCPKKVISDRGTQFTSEVFRELCKTFKVTKLYTTPYHPQTNGVCERFNRVISCYLSLW